jgi:two-component system nitrogen regulation sensor histidine kinase NtrY
VTFTGDTLRFWSGIKFIPAKPGIIKEGVSFIQEANGYYEAVRKTEGSFSAIFFIPIKINYPFQNKYLQNKFAKDLLQENNITIANLSDTDVYGIHSSIDDSYLFAVKLIPGQVNDSFFYFELVSWILTSLALCVLIHAICKYFAEKGYVIISLLVLAVFIAGSRYVNLHYSWPSFAYTLDIFSPIIYSTGHFYPSLGDFCLNILFITWFVAFLYRQRKNLVKDTPAKPLAYLIFIGSLLILILTATALLDFFYGLVINSKINFDVYNVFNLSRFSFLGLLMLCFSFLIVYFLNETFLYTSTRFGLSLSRRLTVFIITVIAAVAVLSYHNLFNAYYILLLIPVGLRGYAYEYHDGRLKAAALIAVLFVFSFISFIKFRHVESIKESITRRALMHKLEIPDDATADELFKRIETQIVADPVIVRNFNDTLHYGYLRNRFQKLYFDGYLTKYTYTIHEFNLDGDPMSADNYTLDNFKDLVLYSSFKVSAYFYRENDSFGFQNYFALLPVTDGKKMLGTIVVELKSKPLEPSGSFPDLLKDGRIKQNEEFGDYSHAFYIDDTLESKSGPYPYDLVNTTFKGQFKKYTTATTKTNYPEWYRTFTTYSHLIYKPSERNMIVISREENSVFYSITSLTFFFIMLLLFSLLAILARWLWLRIKILSVGENSLKWIFKINFDRVLYKTRIQFSIISAVVITLIFVGFITFFSISTQYSAQQAALIRDKISRITTAFESGQFDKYINNLSEESQVDFDNLAKTYSTDLILYDRNGLPLITTQPKIYEQGLQASRMPARAYIYLSKFQKSEYSSEETIGDLKYTAVYAPLLAKKGTVAYLQIPYFSNESDYNARIVSLLNVMINVYALIFIIVGLFAVIIARQITAPLSLVQLNLGKIIYGRKNEPIKWERDDEIGALVKEYNKMISALENSAQKLAQSERESAWREMAKQVAHEIKNPLTPLKLGLQLLEKSWRDKDPKFDQKFERFSKSFVEQIESLSSIASEFSSFAKMPDTHIERINVFEMLTQAVAIFVHMENIRINYVQPAMPFNINADRDQLLRCFNNLLKNAIEATPQDKPGLIDISYTITNKNILLSIKDNGNGIPIQMRSKIFEPNFTTKSSGTGLGLAFVKNSIENAGGKVWFDTATGEGTTFYLSLPGAD